jgi:hypothetical protein
MGKYTSNVQLQLAFSIRQCNNSLNSSRPCANQSVVDAIFTNAGQLFASVAFVNPLINPGNTDYLGYFVEDRNFIPFTQTLGGVAFADVQEYTI